MDASDRERLARIETKLDVYLKDHEARVRSLEKENWLHRGGIAVVAFVASKMAGFHFG